MTGRFAAGRTLEAGAPSAVGLGAHRSVATLRGGGLGLAGGPSAPATPLGAGACAGSGERGGLPEEAGQLARAGDGDHARRLAALGEVALAGGGGVLGGARGP